MSDPTGFVEMGDELSAANEEIDRLNARLETFDGMKECKNLDDHAELVRVREELVEANAKLAAIDDAEPAPPSPLPDAVIELLAALDDRQDANRFDMHGAPHQYRVEQAFRVVRRLVEVASPPPVKAAPTPLSAEAVASASDGRSKRKAKVA